MGTTEGLTSGSLPLKAVMALMGAVTLGMMLFMRNGPTVRARTEVFDPGWVQVEVRSNGRIGSRLVIAQGRRRIGGGCSLGEEARRTLTCDRLVQNAAARVQPPATVQLATGAARSADYA